MGAVRPLGAALEVRRGFFVSAPWPNDSAGVVDGWGDRLYFTPPWQPPRLGDGALPVLIVKPTVAVEGAEPGIKPLSF